MSATDPFQDFAPFGVDETLCRKALNQAMARGATFADLFFEHSTSTSLGMEDGAVNRAVTGVSLGVGVRVVQGDQTGYAYTADLSLKAVLEAAATAALIAEGAQGSGPKVFEVAARSDFYPVTPHEGSAAEQIALCRELEELTFAESPLLKKVQVSFGESEQRVLIVDSDGRISSDRRPMTRLSVGCTAEREKGGKTERENGNANLAARDTSAIYTHAELQTLARDVARRTLFLFDAKPAPAGFMPLVLGRGASGILLHEAMGHGFEADFNRKNVSIYADKLNCKIASDEITIVDDGTISHARGSINFDDEGTPSECTTLVEKGVLTNFMHDRLSAAFYKTAPTGNGRRDSFRSPPIPRMRNTLMMPGTRERDEIIASVERGIYAETFLNGQVMIGAGDFTFYIKTGYLIENGKLTQPIKDTNIIGNGPEVLRCIDLVGNDFRFDRGGWTCGKDGQSVPVSLGMPTVRVSGITVGGQSGGQA